MTQASTQDRPANWQPVLAHLIRENRKIYAVKLLALVFYRSAKGRPDLARAFAHLEAIWCHRRPMPDGSEYPDLSEVELAYYRDNPRSARERQMNTIDGQKR